MDAQFDLGVFRDGRIELVEDFPAFDRNGDGRVNDDDLLFAVTLRSGKPDQDLVIPDADNVYLAGFVQDDWRVHPQLSLNLGVALRARHRREQHQPRRRAQSDRAADSSTLPRQRDTNNWAPRIGFNWSTADARDRASAAATASTTTASRCRFSRSSAASTGGRCRSRCAPATCSSWIRRPAGCRRSRRASPIRSPGSSCPGAGASGINIIDSQLQNPKVQQMSLGVERQLGARQVVRVDVRAQPRHATSSSARTVGDGVQSGGRRSGSRRQSRVERRDRLRRAAGGVSSGRSRAGSASAPLTRCRRPYNYANDDQIPFGSGPIDPNDLRREYGPAANDQRHRLVAVGHRRSRRAASSSPGCGRWRRACRWTS